MVLMVLCLMTKVLEIFADLGFKTFVVVLWKQFTLIISVPEVS